MFSNLGLTTSSTYDTGSLAKSVFTRNQGRQHYVILCTGDHHFAARTPDVRCVRRQQLVEVYFMNSSVRCMYSIVSRLVTPFESEGTLHYSCDVRAYVLHTSNVTRLKSVCM